MYTFNHPRRNVSDAIYIGVTLSNSLSWNSHIANVTKKANSTVGFLRRNIGKCHPDIKKQAYSTFVRPTLEYSCTVWSPHTQVNKNKLESVQRRAARMIKSDYRQLSSPTSMLEELKIPTLDRRRDALKLSMMYIVQDHQQSSRCEF